ncbi:hypothetical protein GQ54DRAFT_76599 [Martensiomyces pterosporus]|nr:hypothetical protein GQ54DRAFT_76599 [Martensiomyces pterosporus]
MQTTTKGAEAAKQPAPSKWASWRFPVQSLLRNSHIAPAACARFAQLLCPFGRAGECRPEPGHWPSIRARREHRCPLSPELKTSSTSERARLLLFFFAVRNPPSSGACARYSVTGIAVAASVYGMDACCRARSKMTAHQVLSAHAWWESSHFRKPLPRTRRHQLLCLVALFCGTLM